LWIFIYTRQVFPNQSIPLVPLAIPKNSIPSTQNATNWQWPVNWPMPLPTPTEPTTTLVVYYQMPNLPTTFGI
jgi:hypothetical protein